MQRLELSKELWGETLGNMVYVKVSETSAGNFFDDLICVRKCTIDLSVSKKQKNTESAIKWWLFKNFLKLFETSSIS
jgi:hypothetical protein